MLAGDMVASMTVREFPPRFSCNKRKYYHLWPLDYKFLHETTKSLVTMLVLAISFVTKYNQMVEVKRIYLVRLTLRLSGIYFHVTTTNHFSLPLFGVEQEHR